MDTDVDVPCSRCSAKQCALAAILGTVAAAVTVALRPPPLSFSITHGTSSARAGALGATWAFTLVAANPSRRAGVLYLMLSVDMDYLATDGDSWPLQAGVDTPCYQPPRNTTAFALDFAMGTDDVGDLLDLGRVNTSVPLIAMVTAKLQFKVGPCYTKPYEMLLTCEHVYFADNSSSVAARREAHAPVNCTGEFA
ncbi:hypothetical protein ACP70R_000198 [Stipagrostis hirtigluma subsp. patula]